MPSGDGRDPPCNPAAGGSPEAPPVAGGRRGGRPRSVLEWRHGRHGCSGVADPRRRESAGAARPVSAPGSRHPLSGRVAEPARHPVPCERSHRRGPGTPRTSVARVLGDDGRAAGAPLADSARPRRRVRDAAGASHRGSRGAPDGHRPARARSARVRPVGSCPLPPRCRQRRRVPRLRERDRRARAPGRPARALVRAQRAGAAARVSGASGGSGRSRSP